jgi:cyclophilin family peptidyl-prolyl cis-trans isomerase
VNIPGDGSPETPADGTSSSITEVPTIGQAESNAAPTPVKDLDPEVLIRTSVGEIRLRLNAEMSPETVDNFLSHYVDRGFYEGTVFHHVDQGVMVIAGGYTSDGKPKEVRAPIRNEAFNGLKNQRGTVAMARHPDYRDTATSQFFINLADNTSFDYVESEDNGSFGYCVFGEVVAGMDIVDKIAQLPVEQQGMFPMMPQQTVVIEAVERLQ